MKNSECKLLQIKQNNSKQECDYIYIYVHKRSLKKINWWGELNTFKLIFNLCREIKYIIFILIF